MAGDHKCPVCQSTFTRPQHVARHMRSHTGDRPYKCQHCGDQFARSDLLSRHVNKCHASEKPPTTTAPNRRKGSAAASRATTSKQACDQCVQSSLPCDGANPCSKCVQRKCRCTYVKFHRQTAPQGPGHPVPNQSPQQGRPMLPGSSRLPDDFLLATPQTQFAFPSMYTPNGNPGPDYSLSQSSTSLYHHAYANPADPRQSPAAPLTMSAGARDGSPDIMARYRAQADLLSRAGVLPNGSLVMGAPPPAPDGSIPSHALYTDAQAQEHFNRYSVPMPASSWTHPDAHPQQSFQGVDEHRKEYDQYAGARQSFPAREGCIAPGPGESTLQTHSSAHGPTFPSLSSNAGSSGGYHSPNISFNHRTEEMNDEIGSDGESTERSHSITGSANSSTIHLPSLGVQRQHARQPTYTLPGFPHPEAGQNEGSLGTRGRNNSSKQEYGSNSYMQDGQGEGGFSSAFGLMSLDDPNVLAGLSTDSAPFFSNVTPGAGAGSHGFSFATPTQDLIAALKTSKNEVDSKEMKDFWKMYVRTPLSGPGAANGLSLATPTDSGQMLGAGRPSPSRRHSRVASMPSMKTPPLYPDPNSGASPPLSRLTLNMNDSTRSQQSHQEHGRDAHGANEVNGNANAFSSMRTTLHGVDDLKSYEQAVLAHKAPMTLNLQPKRKGTLPSGSAAPDAHPQRQDTGVDASSSKSVNVSPVVPHLLPPPPPYMSNKIPDLLNRPSSTASNSSLAHVFGPTDSTAQAHQPQQSRPPSQSGPLSMRPPSVASSIAVGSDAGTDSDSSYRPSFKRLASQTLGPEHTKRALLGPAGWDDDAVDDDDDDDGEYGQQRLLSAGMEADAGAAGKYGAPLSRPMVGLTDRHRRASCPTRDVNVLHPLHRADDSMMGT